MKRFFLLVFILLDLLMIAGAGGYLYWHLTGGTGTRSMPDPAKPSRPIAPVRTPVISTHSYTVGASTPLAAGATTQSSGAPIAAPIGDGGAAGTSKMLFSYRNSKAQKVGIRAEFNGWKAEPMTKDGKGNWVYQVALPPGDYGYCFVVDGKIVRDPNAKHQRQIGQTSISAVIVPQKNAPTPK